MEFLNKSDLFIATETKADDNDILDIDGYTYFSKNRSPESYLRRCVGIGLYIRDSIAPFVEILKSDSSYALWFLIKKDFTHFDEDAVVAAVYFPDDKSRFLNEDDTILFENEISSMCDKYKYVFLAGDWNSRVSELRDFSIPTNAHLNNLFDLDNELVESLDKHEILENLNIPLYRKSCDRKTNTNGLRLINTCRNNNIFIWNSRLFKDKDIGQFTFRNTSLIDYVISTADCFHLVNDFEVLETDALFSDGHSALHFSIKIDNIVRPAPEPRNNNFSNNSRSWHNDKSEEFANNIDVSQLENIMSLLHTYPHSQKTINYLAKQTEQLFQTASEKTFASKKQTKFKHNSNDKSWFGPQCRNARNNYHDARDCFRKNPSNDNRTRLNNASKAYKRTMNYYIEKEKHANAAKLRNMHVKSPKQYWNFLNKLKPKVKGSKSPNIDDFYNHFKNINSDSNHDNDFEFFNDQAMQNEFNDYLNSPISEDDVIKGIKNLKNNKAPSPTDNILNEYIKSTKYILMPFYTKLFNCVFESGIIPDSWTAGTILPIYKNKGDSSDPSNYRPITILSNLGKLFTSILNNRLTKYLDSSGLLAENQAGFRSGYSCSDHILTLHLLIDIMKKKNKKLFCAFIDFSQAFDKVWRVGLWHKLLQNHINGKFYSIITNMYNNIKSCVSHDGNKSEFFPSETGVRQGENLSPALFSMFLNDLESSLLGNGSVGVELKDSSNILWLKLLLLLYADDTIIISDNDRDFQKSLDAFHSYCVEWKLNVNINKTKVVVFGANNLNNFNFTIGQHSIDIVKSYHYLGLTFSSNGSFKKARQRIAEQGSKAMYLLLSKAYNADLPIDLILKLFDHTVQPILLYGSEIFGFENIELIEKVHSEFLRKITRCRQGTPMYMLYGELKRHPLSINIQTRIISFWNRIILGKQDKISYKIYQYALNRPNTQFKWLNKVKSILESIGRPDIWLNQNESASKNIHLLVKRTLLDQFIQKWREDMTNSNKGLIYASFKSEYLFEKYFTILPYSQWLNFFKFRTANHNLPIERGRYTKPNKTQLQDRLCPRCVRREIGSEKHYLLECPFFENERNSIIGEIINPLYPSDFMFNILVNATGDRDLKLLCKFISIIFQNFKFFKW